MEKEGNEFDYRREDEESKSKEQRVKKMMKEERKSGQVPGICLPPSVPYSIAVWESYSPEVPTWSDARKGCMLSFASLSNWLPGTN